MPNWSGVGKLCSDARYVFVEFRAETSNEYEMSYRNPSIPVNLDGLPNAEQSFWIELDVLGVI